MKQKDIALIIVIAFVSGILSFVVSNKLFVSDNIKQIEVEKVDVISSDFSRPDSRYFNSDSINPTPIPKLANTNQDPFNGGTQ